MRLIRIFVLFVLFIQLTGAHEYFDVILPSDIILDAQHNRLSFQMGCDACKKVLGMAKGRIFEWENVGYYCVFKIFKFKDFIYKTKKLKHAEVKRRSRPNCVETKHKHHLKMFVRSFFAIKF